MASMTSPTLRRFGSQGIARSASVFLRFFLTFLSSSVGVQMTRVHGLFEAGVHLGTDGAFLDLDPVGELPLHPRPAPMQQGGQTVVGPVFEQPPATPIGLPGDGNICSGSSSSPSMPAATASSMISFDFASSSLISSGSIPSGSLRGVVVGGQRVGGHEHRPSC